MNQYYSSLYYFEKKNRIVLQELTITKLLKYPERQQEATKPTTVKTSKTQQIASSESVCIPCCSWVVSRKAPAQSLYRISRADVFTSSTQSQY